MRALTCPSHLNPAPIPTAVRANPVPTAAVRANPVPAVRLIPNGSPSSWEQREYLKALVLAVRLNEAAPLEEVYEGVPVASVALVGRDLPRPYLERVLRTVATHLEKAAHLEFNLCWVVALLGPHAAYIRQHRAAFAPTLRSLHKALQEQRDGLVRLADSNRFALDYLLSALRSETGGDAAGDAAGGGARPAQSDAAITAASADDSIDATTEIDAATTPESAQARPKKGSDKRKRTVAAEPEQVQEPEPESEIATTRAATGPTTKRARKPDAASEAAAPKGANMAAAPTRPKSGPAVPAKAGRKPRSTAGTA